MENLITQQPLTELEKTVLTAYIGELYAEPGFSDVDAHDLTRITGIPTRSIRGILSSLIKKDYIWIDRNDSGYQIIHLMEAHYHLHPQWRDEVAYYNNPEKLTYAEIHAKIHALNS
jgi:hypothetical protein